MKLNELIEEEKSLRHVAMVVAKFLDRNTRWYCKYGRKKRKTDMYQWRIQGRGRGGGASLFLDQTEDRRAKNSFFSDRDPPYLRVWMTGPPLSEGLDPPLRMTFLCMIVLRKNKTVAHTFLPSFDNANGHLCQVRLL